MKYEFLLLVEAEANLQFSKINECLRTQIGDDISPLVWSCCREKELKIHYSTFSGCIASSISEYITY